MESPFVYCPHICGCTGPQEQQTLRRVLQSRRILPNTLDYDGLEGVQNHILKAECHSECDGSCPGNRLLVNGSVQYYTVPPSESFDGLVPEIFDFFSTRTQELVAFLRHLEVPFKPQSLPDTLSLPQIGTVHPPASRFALHSVSPELDQAPDLSGGAPKDRSIPPKGRFQIACVLDRRLSPATVELALEHPDFTCMYDDDASRFRPGVLWEAENFINRKKLPKNLFSLDNLGGMNAWVMSEWFPLILALEDSSKFSSPPEFHYLSLSDFVETVSSPLTNPACFSSLCDCQLIVGGVDFSRDFLDKTACGLHYKSPDFKRFFNNLLELNERVFIWPPIDDLIYSGDTVEQMYDIQSAAREQDSPFYNFLIHPDYPELPLDVPSEAVISRTFPVDPEKLGTPEPPCLEKDKKLVSRVWSQATGLVSLQWYSLPKAVEQMEAEFGKISAYFVNGEFRYAVLTGEGRCPTNIHSFVPLEFVDRAGDIVNSKPDGCSVEQVEEAGRNAKSWAGKMLKNLIDVEEKKRSFGDKATSGLRIFCRMDIGIIRGPGGEYRYVVTRIHRSHKTHLYPSSSFFQWSDMMVDLADILIESMFTFRAAHAQ